MAGCDGVSPADSQVQARKPALCGRGGCGMLPRLIRAAGVVFVHCLALIATTVLLAPTVPPPPRSPHPHGTLVLIHR